MDYPKITETRLIPSHVDRAGLFPLPAGVKLKFSLTKQHLEATLDGEVFVLGVTKQGYLCGFRKTTPDTQAAWLCVRTGPFSLRLFKEGQDSAEDLAAFLAPELSEADIAELPLMIPTSDGSFLLLPFAAKPEKKTNIFDPAGVYAKRG